MKQQIERKDSENDNKGRKYDEDDNDDNNRNNNNNKKEREKNNVNKNGRKRFKGSLDESWMTMILTRMIVESVLTNGWKWRQNTLY